MRFRLARRSMTLDDPKLLKVQFLSKFCATSHFWEATTAKPPLLATELLGTENTFQRCIHCVDIAGRMQIVRGD